MAQDEDPRGDRPVGGHPVSQEPPSSSTMRLPAIDPTLLTTPDGPAGPTDRPEAVVDTGTVASLQPGTALLHVDHGPNAGSRFLLDADLTTVGRHPSSDIFLDDVTVSRKHAQFLREADGFVVRDVGSLNGTYVNRKRIDTAPVRTGDEVQIGKFRLVVHLSTTPS